MIISGWCLLLLLCVYLEVYSTYVLSTEKIVWTWETGHLLGDQQTKKLEGHDIYGNAHYPGGRQASAVWNDNNGTVWMFGGFGFDANRHMSFGKANYLNDLWKYDLEEGTWSLLLDPVSETIDKADRPEPRQSAIACGYKNIYFMIHGGFGEDSRMFNDTWLYEINRHVWTPLICNLTISVCISDKVHHPASRAEAVAWCTDEILYMHGGVNQSFHVLNDFWTFSLIEMAWRELPVPKSNELHPAPRNGAVTWTLKTAEGAHELYMFGDNIMNGVHINAGLLTPPFLHRNGGYVAQLWKFAFPQCTWTLLNGIPNYVISQRMVSKCVGRYGVLNVPSQDNRPGCRKLAAGWTDDEGNLWLFGGLGTATKIPYMYTYAHLLSDLWVYNMTTAMWVWMGGSNTEDVANHLNVSESYPGARYDFATWTDNETMYIFGGFGLDSDKQPTLLGDMWSFHMKFYQTWISPKKKDIHPLFVFLIALFVLFTIFGLFGTSLYLKKSLNAPRHPPKHTDKVEVRYTKLKSQVKFKP